MEDITITADVPPNVDLPSTGVFRQVVVSKWHAIDRTTSRVIDDATIPAMVDLTLADGTLMSIWPDGTVVRAKHTTDPGWSFICEPDSNEPNPYRR